MRFISLWMLCSDVMYVILQLKSPPIDCGTPCNDVMFVNDKKKFPHTLPIQFGNVWPLNPPRSAVPLTLTITSGLMV